MESMLFMKSRSQFMNIFRARISTLLITQHCKETTGEISMESRVLGNLTRKNRAPIRQSLKVTLQNLLFRHHRRRFHKTWPCNGLRFRWQLHFHRQIGADDIGWLAFISGQIIRADVIAIGNSRSSEMIRPHGSGDGINVREGVAAIVGTPDLITHDGFVIGSGFPIQANVSGTHKHR